MSNIKTETGNSAEGLRNSSIIQPKEKESDLSATDDMVMRCNILLKYNCSTYDECIKLQEKLRLQLIHGYEEYKSLRSLLENANEDCLRIKSNNSDLIQIYEILLKNKFVNDFVEHGITRERLNLKFLSIMMRCKDLGKSLNVIDGNVTSLKSEYEEIQYNEILLQFAPTEEAIEYSKRGKGLRLRYISVMFECKRLNACLSETCEEIAKLYSEHEELIRFYRIFLQDATVKEFLNYANEEKLQSELAEKTTKCECSKSSLETGYKNVAFSDLQFEEYQEKLITEQQSCERIKKEYSSLDEFSSDKLCHLLLKSEKINTNNDSIQNFSVKSSSIPSITDAVEKFSSYPILEINASKVKEEKNEKMDLDEDEFILRISSSDEDDHSSEEFDVLPDNHSNSRFKNHKSPVKKIVPDSFVEEHDPNRIEKQDPTVRKELSSGNDDQLDSQQTSTKSPDTHGSDSIESNASKCDKSSYSLRNRAFSSGSFKSSPNLPVVLLSPLNLPEASDEFPNLPPELLNQQNEGEDTSLGKHHQSSANDTTNSRKWKCLHCGKTFHQKCGLVQHERIHTGSKPYGCVGCGKQFRQRGHLTQHIRIHARENPFVCLHCGQTFRKQATLDDHMRIHPKGKPLVFDFYCKICDRNFESEDRLRDHKCTLHGSQKKFKCTVCGQRFGYKHSVSRHILKMHTPQRPLK